MGKTLKILMVGPGLDVRGGVTSVENLIIENAPPDWKITHLATHRDGSKLYKIWVFFKALLIVPYILPSKNIVHIHFSGKGSTVRKMIIVFLAKLCGKPVVLHAHGGDYQAFLDKIPNWFKKKVFKFIRSCDRLIVLSNIWTNYYTEVAGVEQDKIDVIKNPIRIPSALPDRTNHKRVRIVYLGLVSHLKGAFDLITAYSKVKPELSDKVELFIAGTGELDKAKAMVEVLKCDNVEIRSWLTPAERDVALQESDVLALPSYYEGLPMSILEAMSWGLPILSTNVGGIPEAVDNNINGILTEPGDIAGITKAIERLVEETSTRLEMGMNARKSAEAYDIKNYLPQLKAVYDKLFTE